MANLKIDEFSKPKKPIKKKSKYPTLVNNLGFLNSLYCPRCGKHLFSYYDKELKPEENFGYHFVISSDVNFCSKCGLYLNLEEYKDKTQNGKSINDLNLSEENIKFED